MACHWRAPRSADSDGRSRCRVPWRQEMRGLRLLSTSLPSPRHVAIQDSPDRRCASDRVRRARRALNVCRRQTSCRMRRDAYQDEECLATEAQQDEAVEEITVEVVDPFIAAYRACVGRTAQWASKVQSLLPPFAITLHVPMSIFPNFIPLILLFTGTIKTSFNLCSPELGCLGSSDNFIISLDGWKNI